MKSIIYSITVVLLVWWVSSCNEPIVTNAKVKNDRVINLEGKDTIRDYFEDSVTLGCVTPYVDGKKDGEQVWYYQSGDLSKTVKYENGKRYGATKVYYDTGFLMENVYYYNDNPLGHAYYYRPNGLLETYSCFDFEGHPRYVSKYDEMGNVIKNEGEALGQMQITKRGDTLKLLVSYSRPILADIKILANIYRKNKVEKVKLDLSKRVGELIFYDGRDVDSVLFIGELKDLMIDKVLSKDSLFYSRYPPVGASRN